MRVSLCFVVSERSSILGATQPGSRRGTADGASRTQLQRPSHRQILNSPPANPVEKNLRGRGSIMRLDGGSRARAWRRKYPARNLPQMSPCPSSPAQSPLPGLDPRALSSSQRFSARAAIESSAQKRTVPRQRSRALPRVVLPARARPHTRVSRGPVAADSFAPFRKRHKGKRAIRDYFQFRAGPTRRR